MSELPGPPLRIAVLGDFDGPHTRAWVRTFVERGHDVHAISYYKPTSELPGVTLHVLSKGNPSRSAEAGCARGRASFLRRLIPISLLRLVNAWRYRRAGLRRVLDEIRPDVFHAHYAVEHGFYGATAGFHPYVISAWGSDLLVESHKTLGRRIATWALKRADLVTGNDASLVTRAVELGVSSDKAAVVHLGIERAFLDAGEQSVNLDGPATATIISSRAMEGLYNIETLLAAFMRARQSVPDSRLLLAGDGSRRPALEYIASRLQLTDSAVFLGHIGPDRLAAALAGAQIYVSIPSSDSMALSNLEAMAAGAFPIVSDLPSMDGWIEDGVNGLRVPPWDIAALADAIRRALGDPELRQRAAIHNRQLVEARGLREPNMLLMERHYYRLAGHPLEDQAI